MKRSVRIIALLLSVVMLALALLSCTNDDGANQGSNTNNNKEETDMYLTERQISILNENGLPTDYNQLTDTQKNDIAAIEAMLVHLENTYNVKAEYVSFLQGSSINDETLTASVNGKKVTVTRTYSGGKFVYDDDYDEVNITEKYEIALKEYFEKKGIFVKAFAQVSNVKADGELLSRVESSNFIFVPLQASKNEYNAFVNEYAQWYAKQLNGVFNETRFYFVNPKDILDYGKENYEDCVAEISTEHRVKSVISAQGKITVS